MMRKFNRSSFGILAVLLVASLTLGVLAGCASTGGSSSETDGGNGGGENGDDAREICNVECLSEFQEGTAEYFDCVDECIERKKN